MNLEDFTLSSSDANRLENVDDLVECGLTRDRSERLTDAFNQWKKEKFQTLLNESFSEVTNSIEASFLRAALVGYLHQWSDDRLMAAAVAQGLALNFLASEKSNG